MHTARYVLAIMAIAASLACDVPVSPPAATEVLQSPLAPTPDSAPTPTGQTPSAPAESPPLAIGQPVSTLPPATESVTHKTESPTSATGQTPDALAVAPPERDVRRLASELIPGIDQDFPWVVADAPGNFEEGRIDTFWIADLDSPEFYQSQFTLALVSPHAYWYVESGESVNREDLERSAAAFEERVYPRVTAVFGSERRPGVDGDPRITIVNGDLRGAGGFFNSADGYPRAVFPYSNQREMIYVNTRYIPIGSDAYLDTLAHELQHLIHWNLDSSEETWVNEGLSELAVTIAGDGSGPSRTRRGGAPVSLVNWPLDSVRIGENYATASLFMHYLTEHYGSLSDMRALVETSTDGVTGIDEYLQNAGYQQTFRDVFRDWAVANFLDMPQGVYGYSGLNISSRPGKSVDEYTTLQSEIPQYAVEYVKLESFSGPIRIRFSGLLTTPILPDDVGPEGCWWSNSGDAIDSTLTGTIDLRNVEHPALRYEVWHHIEENWDYAYLQVSTDGGRHWQILTAPGMSGENPMGTAFGHGYTGNSDGWTTATVNLSAYAGERVKLRFQYLTDDAIHGPGLCLRNVGIVYGGQSHPITDWDAQGFVLTRNRTPQTYIVQVIEDRGGAAPRVTVMELDSANSGEVDIQVPQDSDQLVIAVAALAPKTFQPASYTLVVSGQ